MHDAQVKGGSLRWVKKSNFGMCKNVHQRQSFAVAVSKKRKDLDINKKRKNPKEKDKK